MRRFARCVWRRRQTSDDGIDIRLISGNARKERRCGLRTGSRECALREPRRDRGEAKARGPQSAEHVQSARSRTLLSALWSLLVVSAVAFSPPPRCRGASRVVDVVSLGSSCSVHLHSLGDGLPPLRPLCRLADCVGGGLLARPSSHHLARLQSHVVLLRLLSFFL